MSSSGYLKAPITEAIIDIQFAEAMSQEICDKVKAKLIDQYPVVDDWVEGSFFVDVRKNAAQFQETVRGFRLSSLDQAWIAIIANSRFSTSRLAPYLGWEVFRDRAVNNWDVFKSVAGYLRIKRIGVRYINRIDIPSEPDTPIHLSDYLNLYLQVPQPPFPPVNQQTAQAIFTFKNCTVVVNSATVPSPLLFHASIALDLDYGRDKDVPQNDDAMWAYIEKIRELKNLLFEACVTDHARELFQ